MDISFHWDSQISKIDLDKRLIFGWFSVVEKNGEPLEDLQGDVISEKVMEEAAYDFVLNARIGGEMHKKEIGRLVESMAFTREKQQALGIDLGMVGWWGGFKVFDDDTWSRVRQGERPQFSVAGRARSRDLG